MDLLTGFNGAEIVGVISVVTLGITGIMQSLDRMLRK